MAKIARRQLDTVAKITYSPIHLFTYSIRPINYSAPLAARFTGNGFLYLCDTFQAIKRPMQRFF